MNSEYMQLEGKTSKLTLPPPGWCEAGPVIASRRRPRKPTQRIPCQRGCCQVVLLLVRYALPRSVRCVDLRRSTVGRDNYQWNHQIHGAPSSSCHAPSQSSTLPCRMGSAQPWTRRTARQLGQDKWHHLHECDKPPRATRHRPCHSYLVHFHVPCGQPAFQIRPGDVMSCQLVSLPPGCR